ncbi:hypothetical protein IX332_001880 [Porphyromonas levii]|uniref:Uncharacterized protein n=1 Tax=Porphyromonas levii TaxID=28114 RepID=A0A4Y8WLL9_9PORP|nr:hypothetical protein [Porphyromonas levii]MBR8770641.1 hypothetical protein [Porphyromonas levii]MBR8785624.1 hypothetical protein [Porphyromonas levii]MBR8803629.1 hypothetical protein [Porphyromonas levii]TFH93811.1 hypothetical protein E4P47_10045 [Porphyromonas levii]
MKSNKSIEVIERSETFDSVSLELLTGGVSSYVEECICNNGNCGCNNGNCETNCGCNNGNCGCNNGNSIKTNPRIQLV